MGASTGKSRQEEFDEEFGLQDDTFPWFHIIQWSTEDAKSNSIFRWDLASIQSAADSLTQDADSFLAHCPEELPVSVGFSLEDDKAFGEWAAALLEWSPTLRQVRYRLVPARLKEEAFWSRYFAGLREAVRREIFRDELSTASRQADPDGL
uniref:BSD domain-containing protein n=1 Tax=Pfiesteria piscicida TaxID=71001 RepID=A3E3L9_PFIPI|nr:BSD domain-containing protein [Pfiesteria piscicida]